MSKSQKTEEQHFADSVDAYVRKHGGNKSEIVGRLTRRIVDEINDGALGSAKVDPVSILTAVALHGDGMIDAIIEGQNAAIDDLKCLGFDLNVETTYPLHVSVGGRGATMGLVNVVDGVVEYYRPRGAWSVKAQWVGDKLKIVDEGCGAKDLVGVELVKITEEEFRKDNEGYVL